MLKDKFKTVVSFILKHSKLVFPILVIAAVALTVSVALRLSNQDELEQKRLEIEQTEEIQQDEEVVPEPEVKEAVPMELDTGSPLRTLICVFYTAMAYGDEETLQSVCTEISTADMLRYKERSKYIESYPVLEVYTKPGYDEGSTIAYVYYKVTFADHEEQFPGYAAHYICTDEQGELYINRDDISEEANEYIAQLMSQDDVVEFNNRVTVEYNELMLANPELLEYLSEVDAQISAAVGTALADLNAEQNAQTGAATDENQGETTGEGQAETVEPPVAENVVQYATATTTVNIRSSDSEQADKVGKVSGGSRVQVLEQKVNGWSKIKYDGMEGFIKSEYLEVAESADGLQSIGTVKATTNINVRAAGNESAERIGVLAGGDTVELYATENGWCKINYNGSVGYVKADYVE